MFTRVYFFSDFRDHLIVSLKKSYSPLLIYSGMYAGCEVAVKELFVSQWTRDNTSTKDERRFAKAARQVKTIVREIGILSRLRHQNIVRLYGISLSKPHLLLVMEYCALNLEIIFLRSRHEKAPILPPLRGGRRRVRSRISSMDGHNASSEDSLSHDASSPMMEAMKKRRQNSSLCGDEGLVLLLKIAKEICVGMSFLHSESNGIVHRDLKPANILLSGTDLTVRIADFGLARQQTENIGTQSRQAGTPIYMYVWMDGQMGFFFHSLISPRAILPPSPLTGHPKRFLHVLKIVCSSTILLFLSTCIRLVLSYICVQHFEEHIRRLF